MGIETGTAILLGSLAGGGLGALGSWLSGEAVSDAADSSSQAQIAMFLKGLEFQKEQLDISRNDQAPWRDAGVNSLNSLMGGDVYSGDPRLKNEDFKNAIGYDSGTLPIFKGAPSGTLFWDQMSKEERRDYITREADKKYPGWDATTKEGWETEWVDKNGNPVMTVTQDPNDGKYYRVSFGKDPETGEKKYFREEASKIDADNWEAGPSTNPNTQHADEINELLAWSDALGEKVVGREKGHLNTLTDMINAGPGEFEESPGYQFAVNEGMRGIRNAASAMGGLRSGGHLKAAGTYAEGMADQEYDKFLNRWVNTQINPYISGVINPAMTMAGLGQVSAANMGQQGASAGNAMMNASNYLGTGLANNAMNAGNARGAGILGMTNSLSNWGKWGAGQYLDYNNRNNYMNQLLTPPGFNQNSYGYRGMP